MQKTLGGDRLGAGKKMKVELHGYERSSHNLGYLWRSTMSAGTLVPFLKEVALPGDTFDIDLDCDIKTHPTVGPLFGSYKVQLDVFMAPIRLYQGQLHNNKLGIGMNMSAIKLPVIELTAQVITTASDFDNSQINPSCLLSYLGIRGVGILEDPEDTEPERTFNAVPFLGYWDIYKNYYANKQEEIGAVIHASPAPIIETVTGIQIGSVTINQAPATGGGYITSSSAITVSFTGTTPILSQIVLNVIRFGGGSDQLTMEEIMLNPTIVGSTWVGNFNFSLYGPTQVINWDYISAQLQPGIAPNVVTFPLANLDDMREKILKHPTNDPFVVNLQNLTPYSYVLSIEDEQPLMMFTQEGLAVKTYQSDLFNNWLLTDWIEGPGSIADITKISTTGDSFTVDTFLLAKKVYDMLNRIAVSGGTYDDWQDAVWAHDRYTKCETPMYMGGLIKELVFQEVVSNSQSLSSTGGDGQPLGTLAGKGILSKKHKGGKIRIKVDEPSYIIGIISLTPRIDYSQGNKWDVNLATMDDFHKPALDQIGFQDLITEQMHWSTTTKPLLGTWTQKSAGKQPAWINYMTNVNEVRGNFAIQSNEMFMTLNRRYETNEAGEINDLTTYIDPVKFNHIFAQTSIDAQNFWAQIAVDMTARRKMSAKLMPNL